MKKRVFAFLLVVCMVVSYLPVMSSAVPAALELDKPVAEEEWEYEETLTWTFTPETSGNYYFYVNMFLEEPVFSVQLGNTDIPGTQAQYLGTGYVYNLTANETYTLNAAHQDGKSSNEQRTFDSVEFAVRQIATPGAFSLPSEMSTLYSFERVQGFLIPDTGVDSIASVALVKDNIDYAANSTVFNNDSLFLDLNLPALQMPAGEYALTIVTDGGHIFRDTITVLAPISVAAGSKDITVPAGYYVFCEFNFNKNQPYVFYFDNTDETSTIGLDFFSTNLDHLRANYNDSLSTRGWTFTPTANQTYYVKCENDSHETITFDLNIALGETPTEYAFDREEPYLRMDEDHSLYVRTVNPTDLLGTFQWSSSDPTVADVIPEDTFAARIDCKKVGFVTITAKDTILNITVSKNFFVTPAENPAEFVAIYTDDGVHDIYVNGTLFEKDAQGFNLPQIGGNSLASLGISVTEPVFWTQRDFLGWSIFTYEREYDDDGNLVAEGDVLLPDAENLNTAQMLAYILPAGKEVNIHAQWAGDNRDYYSGVGFHAYDGQITIQQGDQQEQTDSRGDNFRQDGTTIGSQISWAIQSVSRQNYTFEGWLQYRDYSQDIEGKMDLQSDTVYSFQQILAMTVPEDETVFVAKYQEIDIEEYRNAFPGFSGEGEGDSFIPEDATVIDLTKGTQVKTPFNNGEPRYFRFTAPAAGYYALRTDAQASFGLPDFGMALSEEHDYMLSFYMAKDDVLEFVFMPHEDTYVVIEDTPYITKLELAGQDTSKTFIKSNEIDPFALLSGIRVKATFSNGKVTEKELSADFSGRIIGGFLPDNMIFDIENATGKTTPVTLYYGDASLTYNVKLESRKPTKLEVIFPDPVTDIYENTLGDYTDGPNGPYFHYHIVDAIMGTSTYRVTWSDGSTEDFNISENGSYFHGIYLMTDEPMWIQEQSPWGVGKHDAKVYLGENLSATVTFEIKRNNIDHIEFISSDYTSILLGDPDFFRPNGDGTYCLEGVAMVGLSFKAYFKDGTSKVYTWEQDAEHWEHFGELMGGHAVGIWYDSEQAESISKPGKVTTYLYWMGVEDTFETTIVSSIVADNQVSVAPSVMDTAIQNAAQNTVKLDATQSAATTDTITSVVLPLNSMATMADNTMDLEVKLSGDAVVKLDNKALQSLIEQAESADITLVVEQVKAETLTEKQQTQLKNKKVGMIISAQLLSGGEPIWTSHDNQNANKDGSITVSVPFTPPAGTKAERFSVYYVDDDGNMTKMPTKYVDGTLQFTTWHFSDYVALEDEETIQETQPTVPETEATQPNDDIVTNNPQTGDMRQPVLLVGLMLTCALAVVMLMILRKETCI